MQPLTRQDLQHIIENRLALAGIASADASVSALTSLMVELIDRYSQDGEARDLYITNRLNAVFNDVHQRLKKLESESQGSNA